MSKVGKISIDVEARTARFNQNINAVRTHLQQNTTRMGQALDSLRKRANETATAINRFGGYAVAGAATAMVAFVRQQINVADQMGKLAQQTGTTSEFLSSMGLVASQTGTSLESIAKGVQRLSMNMNDMRRGTGEAQESFRLLNIEVETADGTLRNAEDVMKEVANRFAGMEDGADKTALAMRLFGRAGAVLIPMLNQGSEGIENLQKKARELGLVISTETALQAAYLNDQLDLLKAQATGAGRSIALDLVPWLNEAMGVIKLAHQESGLLMAAWVALGAVGDALFTRSLEGRIRDVTKQLEAMRIESDRLTEALGPQADSTQVIAELEAELARLEKQKSDRDAAEKKRMQEALERWQTEAAALRANTEEMIRQGEAQIGTDAEAAKAQDKKNKLLQEEAALRAMMKSRGAQVFASTRTEAEQLEITMLELNELLEMGYISWDTYGRAVEQAKAALAEQKDVVRDVVDEGKDQFEELRRAIDGWGKDSAAAIADFAMRGEASFRDMIDSMIRDLLRMMIYQNVTSKLFGAIAGGLGSLFGGAAVGPAHIGVGGTTAFGMAQGGILKNGNVIPFAKGGIVSQPTIFPMARGAGLMGEAGPEAILPLTRIGGDLGVKADLGTSPEPQPMNVNVAITAVDAASFQALMRRNPGLIVEPIVTALTAQGHRPLINAVKGVI